MKIKDYLKEQFPEIKGMYNMPTVGDTSIRGSRVKVPHAITPKTGVATFRVGMDQLSTWQVNEAIKKVIYVMNWWGSPNVLTHNKAKWFKVGGFDKVLVMDETVPHTGMGEFHNDCLYCVKNIVVPPEFQSQLAEFLPNVMYDGLKKQVTVRCNDIIMNAVTLGFVEDVIKGEVEPTYEAYMERVDGLGLPDWFEQYNHEWLHQEERDKEYLNSILEGFSDIGEAQKHYEETYPDFTPESIEKGLKAAWRKHENYDPITMQYFLSHRTLGGLGFGKEK